MAIRRVYYINKNKVVYKDFDIIWHGGFSVSQKQKNIAELHKLISDDFNVPLDTILEVSTKSNCTIGKELSSFNLKININGTLCYLESIYQSSKVFSDLFGETQYEYLLFLDSHEAKKTLAQQDHSKLVKFRFLGKDFSLKPEYLFYDWLYINAVNQIPYIYEKLKKYNYFTDIEFNPEKSKSCQARSLSLFIWLKNNNKLEEYFEKPDSFYRIK